MREYQQAPRVNEPKDMRMWGCEDTNKHTEYMNLRIRGCEDTRLETSTHKPKDMRMWGCEVTNKYLEYMNLKIRGCKDARIQARTHEPKDMRMRGYKHLHRCKIHISISISRSIYLYTWSIYLMILCSLHLYSGARYTKHYPFSPWFSVKQCSNDCNQMLGGKRVREEKRLPHIVK